MNRSILAISMVAGLSGLFMQQAQAAPGPWEARVRATHLSPANESAPLGGVGAADRIHVSDKTIPEFDISYFFTPNLAAELVLTIPQKHDVTLDGVKIGTFKHLPPTLLAQYHFAPASSFSPYLGAGLNYTNISKVHLLDGAAELEHSSVGLALQAGANFHIDERWSVNVDLKKVQIRSDVTVGGAKVSKVKVDPVLFAVGVGYRF
jgi:outer membrane protein